MLRHLRLPVPTAAAVVLAAAGACTPRYVAEDRTDRREKALRIEQHVGGTHHATCVAGGRLFQTFGNELLVVDVTNGRELGRTEGVAFGAGGPLSDLVVEGDRAFAVSSATALVEFDVSGNGDPAVVASVASDSLGLEPQLVSVVDGEAYVSGAGGVVRLSDRTRYLTGTSPMHVVPSAAGLVTCSGRKIVALEDGRYLGAATALSDLPEGIGPKDGFAFVLQGSNGASVGLMGPAFAEVARASVPALVRRLRVCGDRLFAVTDRFLYTWRIDGAALVDHEEIPLKGGRDIALIRPNHYAVCGTFGRAMYRHRSEDRRDGDTFYNVERQAGMLEVAVTDGRRILAGGREGFWLWRIGGEAELSDRTTDLTTMLDHDLSAAWGSVHLVKEKGPDGTERGVAVEVRHAGGTFRHEPDGNPRIFSIELVDGDVWVGHERGLDVLRRSEAAAPVPAKPGARAGTAPAVTRVDVLHRWRFEGPVLFIYPERIGGGAAMVSLHGGFVLAKPAPVGDAPVFKGRGEIE